MPGESPAGNSSSLQGRHGLAMSVTANKAIFLPDSYHKLHDWSYTVMGWVSLQPSEAAHL